MAQLIRIQYSLPNAQDLDRLLADDLILRYVKDGYVFSEHCVEAYDYGDWTLARSGFSLSVIRTLEIPVVKLLRGHIDAAQSPGLFRGEQWIAPFLRAEDMVQALAEQASPPELLTLTAGLKPEQRFFILYSRKATTLYLPERTRVEMRFDSGELVVGGQRRPLHELSLELLFGDERLFLNHCQQLFRRFSLTPVLLSRSRMAQQLLTDQEPRRTQHS